MALIKKFRIKSFKEQETILQLDKISMFYNKRQILNNLNLKINKQEVLGMLGPTGVGKSTIFHIITGLKDPSFGKFINGQDVLTFQFTKEPQNLKLIRSAIWRFYSGFEFVRKFKLSWRDTYKR